MWNSNILRYLECHWSDFHSSPNFLSLSCLSPIFLTSYWCLVPAGCELTFPSNNSVLFKPVRLNLNLDITASSLLQLPLTLCALTVLWILWYVLPCLASLLPPTEDQWSLASSLLCKPSVYLLFFSLSESEIVGCRLLLTRSIWSFVSSVNICRKL